MTRTTRCVIAAALMLVVGLAGCDSFEGTPSIDHVGPVVSDLVLAPSEVSVDSLVVTEDGLDVPLEISVRASRGDAEVDRVRYSIEWQFACARGRPEVQGEMEPRGDDLFSTSPELVLPPGRRGGFRVTTWAVDSQSRLSNEASAILQIGGTNLGPPVITTVDAPTEVQPPATMRFLIEVDDPDGLDHIARAEITFPGGGVFPMADTDTAGNSTPCDGRYSAAFHVPAGNEPGLVTFTLQAFDRDGAASEPVEHTVRILG